VIDKEMLEAMRAIMKDELVPINDRLDKVDNRLDKVDTRLDKVDTRLEVLENNVNTISERTIKIELVHGKKLDGLYESVVGTGEKFARLDTLENKVEDYGHRIWALEQVVKK